MILDVSRLLASAWAGRISGMERVELAYVRHALARPGAVFAAQSPWGWFAALPRARIEAVLAGLAAGRPRRAVLACWAALAAGRGRAALARAAAAPGAVFLIVSHRALNRERAIGGVTRHGARFVPFVHDLIPLEFPEYTRPRQTRWHAARMANVARLAAGVVVQSRAVEAALARWLAGQGLAMPPAVVAPLGLDLRPGSAAPVAATPYFLCVATIEPRKNHLLLAQLWRSIQDELGDAAPRLVLVGRAGFENEPVRRFLERHPGIAEWRGACPDHELAALLGGARALLFPSFAEGFGIPVAEALAFGTPVLAADLPALREVGGEVPEYLHPLEGLAWREAVLDYAQAHSARRAAQLGRMAGWRAPGWEAHFAHVERFLGDLAAGQN